MNYLLKWGIGFALLGLLFACGKETSTQETPKKLIPPFVQPPIPQLDIAYQAYEFDAEKGGTFAYKTGSSISIPANALVDSEGKAIKGKVTLEYREFHDALDVMLSGVPMAYDSAGVARNFQTAGMFDIRASQKGKSLSIASDKRVEVKMASWQADKDYNFYALDTTARRWNFEQVSTPEINERKVKMRQALETLTPFDPSKTLVLNYEQALDIVYQDNWELIKANRDAYLWRFKQYGVDYMHNVRLQDAINFQGNEYPAFMLVWESLDGVPIPNWIRNNKEMITGYEHDLKATPMGNGIYLIQIKHKKTNLQFTSKMRPLMRIASLLQFTPEQWKSRRAEIMEKIRLEEEKIAKVAEVFRSVEISDFGIYNFDRMLKEEGAILVNANFTLPQSKDKPQLVYYINPQTRGVVKYSPKQWQSLSLLPDTSSRIFAIMPNYEVALYRPEDYAKIDFEALGKQENAKYRFGLQAAELAATREALKKVLQIAN